MNRSQKKCLIVSAALHVGLLSSVVLLSAFRPAAPPGVDFQPIDFTPVVTTSENMSGGGNPNGQTLQAPPPPPPVQAAPKPAEPAPRQAPRETQPKPEEDSLTPTTRPTPRKPQTDLSDVVTRPRNEKRKARPKDVAEDSQAQDRELVRAQADSRRRLAQEIRQMAGQIGGSHSGPISVELKGPGGGGLPYANFRQGLYSIYEQAWIIPDGATESDATTEAKITIARDGSVISAMITRSSGNAAVDDSVQLALDRVRQVPPPPSSEKEKVTVTINFIARPQNKRSF